MKLKELIEALKGNGQIEIRCMVYAKQKDGMKVWFPSDIKILDTSQNGDITILGVEIKEDE